jgi:phosphatidylglycerophosphate synthase
MLDPLLRRWIDPSLNRAGAWLARRDVSANTVSLAGLAVGLVTVPLLAWQQYHAGLAVIVLNRLMDGLDGAIARHKGTTRFGGYLDIMCDMGFYAAVPVGFALARPDNALWAALLLASFVCTASSFLGRAVLAAQRGEPDDGARGTKSFFHAAGIIEGTETVIAFLLFCLFPLAFPWLAGVFALLCFGTAAARVIER